MNSDGSRGKLISQTFIEDGQDGKTPSIEQQPVKDEKEIKLVLLSLLKTVMVKKSVAKLL